MEADASLRLRELRADGGAAANDFLMQFQADLLGVPVLRPRILETTALGAAYLCGLTTGLWKSQDALAAQWKLDRRFDPTMSRSEASRLLDGWHDAVRRANSFQRDA